MLLFTPLRWLSSRNPVGSLSRHAHASTDDGVPWGCWKRHQHPLPHSPRVPHTTLTMAPLMAVFSTATLELMSNDQILERKGSDYPSPKLMCRSSTVIADCGLGASHLDFAQVHEPLLDVTQRSDYPSHGIRHNRIPFSHEGTWLPHKRAFGCNNTLKSSMLPSKPNALMFS
jgi:hypothetical protein